MEKLPLKKQRVIDALLTSMPTAEIAQALGYITHGALKTEAHRVMKEIGVRDRTELMAKEIERLRAVKPVCVKCGKGMVA